MFVMMLLGLFPSRKLMAGECLAKTNRETKRKRKYLALRDVHLNDILLRDVHFEDILSVERRKLLSEAKRVRRINGEREAEGDHLEGKIYLVNCHDVPKTALSCERSEFQMTL